VARHFHSVRISVRGKPPSIDGPPLLVYLNHAAWWDPLMGLILAHHFWPDYRHFAPIDAAALRRYPILSSIGFFGVEAGTVRGAASFLRTSKSIFQTPRSAIWITGEGRFRDPRTRPVELRPGLAHLARRSDLLLIPLAIEYPFWEERFPEALCRFGQLIPSRRSTRDTRQWTETLEAAMQANQDALAAEAIARKRDDFETLVGGSAGVGFFYDAWRWAAARLRGERFRREHGDLNS
jgi:1-acyl-sn-glycerol-3-phosphate acyltransferase